MLKVQKFVFNPFFVNTYIIWNETIKDAIVIDPGCYGKKEENELAGFIEQQKLNIKHIINTHCHIDHILGNHFLMQIYKVDLLIPEDDLELLENASSQAAMFGIDYNFLISKPNFITEEMKIKIEDDELNFLFTPGHTKGEFCMYCPQQKICFTGDVLFKESIGRTDLWGGDYKTLINSIRNKLLVLPDETIIFPGHGESSTIKYENINNPFLI